MFCCGPITTRAVCAHFSSSAATEGVEEGDGGKAGASLAPLLDTARRGPAVLLLANTDKAGLKIRGSGTLPDRSDIVFEVRDATDLKFDVRMEAWSDALPTGGEEDWKNRTKRRRRRESYRLGLICTKMRGGEEPDPLGFEIDHGAEPWNCREVTAEIMQQFEDVKRRAADAEQAKLDAAVAALRSALPLPKPDAIQRLQQGGLSRNAGRRLIGEREGRDWVTVGAGTKTDPYILKATEASAAADGDEGEL
jgi:hypothetical protein